MTSMPTSDVAVQVVAPKAQGTRGFDKVKGAADAGVNVSAHKGDRARSAEKLLASSRAEKAAEKVEAADDDDASFDAVVEKLDDKKEATPEAEAAVMEFTAPPSTTLSQELAALFQGVVASGAQGEAVAQNAVKKAIEAATSGEYARALASVDAPEMDATPFVNSLPTRSETFALLDQGKLDPDAQAKAAVADVPADATEITVDVVKLKTGFDAPVTVKTNQQTRFQDAVPVQTSIGAFVSARETNADVRSVASTKTDTTSASQPVAAPVAEAGQEQAPAFGNGQSKSQGDNSAPSSGDRSSRDVKSERIASPAKSLAGTLASVALSANADAAPPYQQIRAAVSEAIFVTNGAQRTDYVSMYADRPALSNPTLKTLEISLNPPELGRVNVKMNLASRDLKLEIEASKASTAQMLSHDQSALKRELLSDNFDLSSVAVSVTSAVADPSSAASLNSGGDQSQSNARTAGQDSFASASGGRDDSRQRQGSAFSERGAPQPQQRDAEPEGGSRRVAGDALYI